jgi:hypothetical protein
LDKPKEEPEEPQVAAKGKPLDKKYKNKPTDKPPLLTKQKSILKKNKTKKEKKAKEEENSNKSFYSSGLDITKDYLLHNVQSPSPAKQANRYEDPSDSVSR